MEQKELIYQVGEVWKGVYNPSTAYSYANVVQSPDSLSIYRSLTDGNTSPLTDSSAWFLIIDLSSISEEGERLHKLEQVIAESEAERVRSEQARSNAELSRISAETQRVTSENLRSAAETDRSSAEQRRNDSETQRVVSENNRETSEENRIAAEHDRLSSEVTRKSNETERKANEFSRVSAESNRSTAEQSRVSAEDSRASAEASRVTAEAERVKAEKSRQSSYIAAEAQRNSAYEAAESKRNTLYNEAETVRQQSYTTKEASRDSSFNQKESERDAIVDAKVEDITNLQEQIAVLNKYLPFIKTVAEGFVRISGSEDPALSYASFKYNADGSYAEASVFSLFYPCLVGTIQTGAETVGKILHVLKKTNWHEDLQGNSRKLDGSEGNVLVCNIKPYYQIAGRYEVEGVALDIFLRSRVPFSAYGVTAELVEVNGMSPDYCVAHRDDDGVTRMYSVYNEEWAGTYSNPLISTGKYIHTLDKEGNIVKTYDENTPLLVNANGLHTTDLSLPAGEQYAMNQNTDTTKSVPYYNHTARSAELLMSGILAEGGTWDAHRPDLMGSGFCCNNVAKESTYNEGTAAENGYRYMDTTGYRYRGFSWNRIWGNYEEGMVINSWRNPFRVMEAALFVCEAIASGVGENTWYAFRGDLYKWRSIPGFVGPHQGEMTCVVFKKICSRLKSGTMSQVNPEVSIEGNDVEFVISTALFHGVITQLSPSWWTSGLIFLEDENGTYEAFMQRDQSLLEKSPVADNTINTFPFQFLYYPVGTYNFGEGYRKDFNNDCLMLPLRDSVQSGGSLHRYVCGYNWFNGVKASAGKKSVRGFRRGSLAGFGYLSPLALSAVFSPSDAASGFGFGIVCRIENENQGA